jgi:hypothetical protein
MKNVGKEPSGSPRNTKSSYGRQAHTIPMFMAYLRVDDWAQTTGGAGEPAQIPQEDALPPEASSLWSG